MSDNQAGVPKTDRPSYFDKWKHHQVAKYIRACDEYIVHIDINGKLDWEVDFPPDSATTATEQEKRVLNSVLCEIVVNESASLTGYSSEHREQYLTMLGEAYVHWILHDPVTAKTLVKAAKQYYRERSAETSRRWYLQSAIRVSSLLFVAGVLGWIGQKWLISVVGNSAFHYGIAAVAGSVGALFSVIARTGKLQFKASAGKDLHDLEAASRVCAGAISGVIVYLALTSELILGAMLKNSHRPEIALLASIAGGAAERLATSIISKFDEAKSTEHSEPTTEEESKDK